MVAPLPPRLAVERLQVMFSVAAAGVPSGEPAPLDPAPAEGTPEGAAQRLRQHLPASRDAIHAAHWKQHQHQPKLNSASNLTTGVPLSPASARLRWRRLGGDLVGGAALTLAISVLVDSSAAVDALPRP